MSLHIAIACGGTGGHLFPGIAVAEELRKRGHECLVLISRKEIDTLASAGYEHLRFEKLDAIGMPKLLSPKIVPFAVGIWRTLGLCRAMLREFKADAVLGMGGFTSLPPVWAGRKLGARTFIHDSNAIPGKANRVTARFADCVFLGMEECAAYFPKRRTEVTGTPIRSSLLVPVTRAEAEACFGFQPSPEAKTLLVTGGSQGARGINRGLAAAAAELRERVGGRLRIIHLAGREDAETVAKAYAAAGIAFSVEAFCPRMECAYALADLVVSRSGASSLTELAMFGLPSVLVPYPYAAEDHQTRNAETFTRRNAAIMLREADLAPVEFGRLLGDLLADAAARARIGAFAKNLATPRSAENIAALIEEKCRR